MIRLLPNYLSALLFITLLMGCDKDERDINLNLTPVKTLYAPEDNLSVKLQPATGASVIFEWESAKAEDGTLVMYELAFDKEDGDFTQPVYKIASDGNGVQNKMTLTHKDLNKIADLAGIESLATGNLKWTAFAYKGTNVLKGEASRIISVERPAGFSVIPSDVYLSGDGTEAGADLANAIQMKQTSSGVFEAFTALKPGTLKFTSAKTGTPVSYQLEGEFIKEGEGQASPAATEKPYRIQLDFNAAAAKLTEITAVEYYFSPNDSYDAQLQYKGGGIWSAENVNITFKQESWGRDERYKFRLKGKDAAGQEIEMHFGSKNRDNQRATNDSPPDYFYLVEFPEFNRWDYTFKFKTEVDGKNNDIILKFAPGAEYTHEIIVK
jgi:starch-binding outer membrane protein SusE/F